MFCYFCDVRKNCTFMNAKKRKNFWKNIKVKYRLSITNESHLNEVFSVRLSRLKIFFASCLLFGLIFLLVSILILATPIKYFLPGYLDEKFRSEVVNYSLLVDSLTQVTQTQNNYYADLARILTGEKADEDTVSVSMEPVDTTKYKQDNKKLAQSEREAEFRKKFEETEKYNISISDVQTSALPTFFQPAKGIITSQFDAKRRHYGIDIATALNEPVLSVLDGLVIFTGFDLNVGYVVVIQHSNEFISVYKHNALLLKREGESVRAGDVIAMSGNTGSQTTGDHLHFELWHKRKAVDPSEYILFK